MVVTGGAGAWVDVDPVLVLLQRGRSRNNGGERYIQRSQPMSELCIIIC